MSETYHPLETLRENCIITIAHLLKNNNCHFTLSCRKYNPFCSFPSYIIEDLIYSVVKLSSRGGLQHKELYPLLNSGRVENFELCDILIPIEEFKAILESLENSAKGLIKLVFGRVHCTNSDKAKVLRSEAVEKLLRLTTNLEHLCLDIPVDIDVLKGCTNLKWLELSFFPRAGDLNSLFVKTKSPHTFSSNNLQHISIFEGSQCVIPVEMLALLLQHAPKLIHIENNIADALELLHSEEFESGNISHQYMLSRVSLGSSFLHPDRKPASLKAVKIAAATCPYLSEIDLVVNSHDAILALSQVKALRIVIIQWADVIPSGDFQVAFLPLIEILGHQLHSLGVIFFSNVDFNMIISHCPNLITLKVIFEMETQKYCWIDNSLNNLEKLHIECMNSMGPSEDILVLLISKCPNMKSLFLVHVPHFTDNALYKIGTKVTLAKLQDATIIDCSLSIDGLKWLIQSCPLLETMRFRSQRIVLEEAAAAIRHIDCKVKMMYI